MYRSALRYPMCRRSGAAGRLAQSGAGRGGWAVRNLRPQSACASHTWADRLCVSACAAALQLLELRMTALLRLQLPAETMRGCCQPDREARQCAGGCAAVTLGSLSERR